jgi:hypothetical protein
MLAKILTSEVPFTSVNGQIYIDIDPVSFRVITSILQGITTETELTHISDRELVLLVATTRYLLCTDLVERLKMIQDERDGCISQLLSENKNLVNKAIALKVTVDELNNSREMKIGKGISTLMPMTKIACNMPSLTASRNLSCKSVALLKQMKAGFTAMVAVKIPLHSTELNKQPLDQLIHWLTRLRC